MNPKVPYFFFPRKSLTPLTHQFWENCVFFFFRIFGKKKYRCISFFPRNSLKATHSAERQLPLRKRYFCTFSLYFFFSNKNVYFFFPWNSLPATHSLVLKGRKKKNTAAEKKKYSFSLTNSIFPQKGQKINFSGEKKIRYLWLTLFLTQDPKLPEVSEFLSKMFLL